jgi:hypothetical protein
MRFAQVVWHDDLAQLPPDYIFRGVTKDRLGGGAERQDMPIGVADDDPIQRRCDDCIHASCRLGLQDLAPDDGMDQAVEVYHRDGQRPDQDDDGHRQLRHRQGEGAPLCV